MFPQRFPKPVNVAKTRSNEYESMNNGVLFPTKGLGDAILLDGFLKIFSGFSGRFAKFIIYLEALVLAHTTIKVSHEFYYVCSVAG